LQRNTIKSHIVSFFSSKQSVTDQPKGDASRRLFSSGSFAAYSDQLKTGESSKENVKKHPNVV
jgi:hypothetical protein